MFPDNAIDADGNPLPKYDYNYLKTLENQKIQKHLKDSDKFDKINPINLDKDFEEQVIRPKTGRLNTSFISKDLINGLLDAADKKHFDRDSILALASRESTIGFEKDPILKWANKRDIISGWNIDEKNRPYNLERFLADNKFENIKKYEDKGNNPNNKKIIHGLNFQPTVENWQTDNFYLNKELQANGNVVNKYIKKVNETKPVTQNSYENAIDFIREKGISNYNSGEKDYQKLYSKDLQEIKSDKVLQDYVDTYKPKFKYGGIMNTQTRNKRKLPKYDLGTPRITKGGGNQDDNAAIDGTVNTARGILDTVFPIVGLFDAASSIGRELVDLGSPTETVYDKRTGKTFKYKTGSGNAGGGSNTGDVNAAWQGALNPFGNVENFIGDIAGTKENFGRNNFGMALGDLFAPFITEGLRNKDSREMGNKAKNDNANLEMQQQMTEDVIKFQQYPRTGVTGRNSYFGKYGLKKLGNGTTDVNVTDGGTERPLSSDTTLLQGRQHSQGGMEVSDNATGQPVAEVQGGEVMTKQNGDTAVLSKDIPFANGLSFADMGIILGKEKGKLESELLELTATGKKERDLYKGNSIKRNKGFAQGKFEKISEALAQLPLLQDTRKREMGIDEGQQQMKYGGNLPKYAKGRSGLDLPLDSELSDDEISNILNATPKDLSYQDPYTTTNPDLTNAVNNSENNDVINKSKGKFDYMSMVNGVLPFIDNIVRAATPLPKVPQPNYIQYPTMNIDAITSVDDIIANKNADLDKAFNSIDRQASTSGEANSRRNSALSTKWQSDNTLYGERARLKGSLNTDLSRMVTGVQQANSRLKDEYLASNFQRDIAGRNDKIANINNIVEDVKMNAYDKAAEKYDQQVLALTAEKYAGTGVDVHSWDLIDDKSIKDRPDYWRTQVKARQRTGRTSDPQVKRVDNLLKSIGY